jgi:hypothetical protein
LAELKRLYGDAIDAAAKVDVPGMEAVANHKYSRNILVDFKPGESPMRPEAVEIMRQRAANSNPAEVCSAGQFGIPLAGLLAEVIKIIQAPRMSVIFYEIDNLHRQVMGHMSRAMLERYSHIRMAAKREAVKSLSLPDLTEKTPNPKEVAKDSAKVKGVGAPN